MENESKAIAVTAPSGAGKTTIVHYLMKEFSQMAFSISATTRPKRPNEKDGVDYYFLSENEFKRRVKAGEFVEWQEVYPGIFYGTLKSEVQRLQNEGKVIVFDIDVKGAENLKKAFGLHCLTVFIKPPGIEVLRHRLAARHTEDAASLEKRIGRARFELSFENKFDVTLINDDLQIAKNISKSIVRAFLSAKIPL